MAAFAKYYTLDAQVQRRLPDPLRDFVHLFIVADEHGEVGGFGSVRADRPLDAGLMKDLCVTDKAINMGLGEEIGGWRDEQDVSALFIDREANHDAGFFFDVSIFT